PSDGRGRECRFLRSVPGAVEAASRRGPWGAVAARLHALHSGHVGDYAAWLTAGVAVLALLTAPW
ncbi:hypothetical protein, partial [Actinomadura geliboluensis]